jgi:cysteinyl-tRNA synthetase
MHQGLLTVNGQKMAKSSGNFITIPQALSKYTVDEIKMVVLFSHYASNIDFTEDKVHEARKALEKFDVLFYRASNLLKDKDIEPIQAGFISKYKHEFIEAMDDDFNTPKALAALFNLISDTNIYIDQNSDDPNFLGVIYHAVDVLENLSRNIFGLFMQEKDKELTAELKALLQERLQARELKNFKRSDELRAILKEKGMAVEDGKTGQTWRWI